MPFLLLPLGALGGEGVAATQVPTQYQHITMGSPWVDEVYLLQYNYGFPDMSVEEKDPYRHNPRCLPPTPPRLGSTVVLLRLGTTSDMPVDLLLGGWWWWWGVSH